MDKRILADYIDACELVKDTEDDIRALEKKSKTIVRSVVKGSMPEFPYAAQNFHVEGIPHSALENTGQLEDEKRLLEEREKNAGSTKIQVEAWMNTISKRMQRIIRYSVFQKLTWDEVAIKMGRRSTADGVRKEFERFMREK